VFVVGVQGELAVKRQYQLVLAYCLLTVALLIVFVKHHGPFVYLGGLDLGVLLDLVFSDRVRERLSWKREIGFSELLQTQQGAICAYLGAEIARLFAGGIQPLVWGQRCGSRNRLVLKGGVFAAGQVHVPDGILLREDVGLEVVLELSKVDQFILVSDGLRDELHYRKDLDEYDDQ